MQKNLNFAKLKKNYLFPEVEKRVQAFRQKEPSAQIISLGIGDTVEPIPFVVAKAMADKTLALATQEGYRGYGPSYGNLALREKIASTFYTNISADEITISDGAKPDIERLQVLFGTNLNVLIQDPCYPVYVDTSLLQGHTIHYLPCNKENHFFPNLKKATPSQLIFFCSPNNPTGKAATHAELTELVRFAKEHQSVIIFDAAYALYIQDPSLPKSIYEIPGSHEVAIEINSFSKIAGFSGIRLGWTVVPKALNEIHDAWLRLISTAFNGASIISQEGGLAALSTEGMKEIDRLIHQTMSNVTLLKQALSNYEVIGGEHAPYIFLNVSPKNSWDAFQAVLEKHHLITTPGTGFGSEGEHYLRLTAFAAKKNIEIAANRLQKGVF